jgi:hypothetical protein
MKKHFRFLFINTFLYKIYGRTVGLFKRWWLKPRVPRGLSPEKFLNLLTASGANYVLLRWHEDLFNGSSIKDLDILIDENSIDIIEALIKRNPLLGNIDVDIFSIKGSSGYGFRSISYFPPWISTSILEKKILYKNVVFVPSEFDASLSLAYHSLFHKGPKNLPVTLFDDSQAKFDIKKISKYCKCYKSLDPNLGEMPYSWINIYNILKKNDWLPPLDVIYKLRSDNSWLDEIIRDQELKWVHEKPLAIIVVRDGDLLDETRKILMSQINLYPIKIRAVFKVDFNSLDFISKNLRGGNWSTGRFLDNNENLPKMIFFITSNISEDEFYDLIKNIKLFVRKAVGANLIHTTDNKYEAYWFLEDLKSNTNLDLNIT